MRDRRVLVEPAVLAGGNLMIEHEHVPGEPAPGARGTGDALEHARRSAHVGRCSRARYGQ